MNDESVDIFCGLSFVGKGGVYMTKKSYRFFDSIERVGNKIPNPFLLFVYLTAILVVVTAIISWLGLSVHDPASGEAVRVKNLLSAESLQWFLPNVIKNFSGFLPLGYILALILAFGLAEQTGLLEVLIRKMTTGISGKYASYVVVFIAFFSHVSSDAAIVIMPPLGAIIFMAVGRHPIAGLLATIAGVASGFTANMLIVTTDVLLSGISSQISTRIDKAVSVSVLDNWFFMATSVILLTIVISIITDKFVEPRLGTFKGKVEAKLEKITPQQNKALKATGIAGLIYVVIIACMVIPKSGILRDPEHGTVLPSPFMSGIVGLIMGLFFVVSITYGCVAGVIKKQNDIPELMVKPMKGMAGFIILVFPLSQFVALFSYSDMGKFIALSIVSALNKMGVSGLPVVIGLLFISALMSLFIASGSAIWSMLAPVFIPLFMMLGYHPAFAQVVFRVADSSVIPLSPVSPFVPLFLGFLQKYRPDAKLGTYYSLILPYPIIILIVWILFVVVWYLLGLPIGPGIYPIMK